MFHQSWEANMSGVQYYWFIATGLLLYIPIAALSAIYGSYFESNPIVGVVFIIIGLYPFMCWLIVMWELWQRFKLKLILGLAAAMVLSSLIHTYFFSLILLGPIIYWFFRINSIPNANQKK